MTDENAPVEAEITDDEIDENEQPEQPQAPVTQPKKDSVIKLLEQRNAHKARADALETKLKEIEPLVSEVSEIKELLAKQAVENEIKQARDTYYSGNPIAKELEGHIDAIVADKGLSYDEAFKLAAAENKPELLLEAAILNKNSGGVKMTGVQRAQSTDPKSPADYNKMSDADFLKWSNAQGQAERQSQGFLR